ncbi:MAG: methyltransferase domain-containing protein [Nitrospira sp.]
MLVPERDVDRRQKLLDEFFSFIARDYESLIDRDRNIDNIRNLLDFAKQYVPLLAQATIIDYGCGTGLSHLVAEELHLNIIGLDRCPSMRAIAFHRGMKVWNPGDLARQPNNSLDVSLASYVFHLLPDTKGLELLWERIRPGGVLVANFHKDAGKHLVRHCLEEKGCMAVKLLAPYGSERHGPYFAFVKP